MKKLLPIIIVLAFISCKKQSSNQVTPNSQLVGKWTFKKDSIINYNKTVPTSQTFTYTYSDYLVFNNDGTGAENDTTLFKYTLSGKNLNISYVKARQPDNIIITNITNGNLTLFYDYTYTDAGGLEGNSVYEYLTKN